MRTSSRSVTVAVFDEVELLDVAAPLQALTAAGRRYNFRPFSVKLAALRAGWITTQNQIRLEASVELAAVAATEVLVLPGGYGARRLAGDPEAVAQIARLGERAEWLLGIGWGVAVLAQAGLVEGARVAGSGEVAEALRESAPTAEMDAAAPWVEAGRLLTAARSAHALRLGLRLVELTLGPKMCAMLEGELGADDDRARIQIVPARR